MNSGKVGEEFAVKALLELGYKVIEVNFYSRYGEVDIIATDGVNLCFVEVKTRRHGSMVGAEMAVTPTKQRKIIKTALSYLSDHSGEFQPRFDVFCIYTGRNGEINKYDYITGAFDGEAYYKND